MQKPKKSNSETEQQRGYWGLIMVVVVMVAVVRAKRHWSKCRMSEFWRPHGHCGDRPQLGTLGCVLDT
jgi:hypothetical protein